ncbi:4-hydroxy-2-oxoglutarate aldolase, mitochondrial [Orchesella cincta]|uniref:4-hydroxy-2-oxoglutarate aldolase, mitochondrial n=1 Tax=Orchesella cincta TaxID=48709 RepID=A0A1D2N401_ORCCI|nr:4-hydroxy-2-oxoglutarate aldolase, mitochondrial [Orchesella cincta]
MKQLRSVFSGASVASKNLQWYGSSRCFSNKSTKSSSIDISGVYPPIPTPFTSNGQIDYVKLQENFHTWNASDFAGYVVMGSNGEAVSLKEDEKLDLVRNVKKMSKPTSTIIAGLGLPTTEQTIEICNRVAEEKTANAALIVSPSFYKGQMNELVLRKFYEDVADNSKLPIIVYSVPANTNLDLSSSLVTALAQHPNIIGLKDSGGDIAKISEIVYNVPKDFQVLAGSAGFMLPALLMGCVGGICALANVLGDQVCLLYRLFKDNDLKKAVALQQSLISPNYMVTRRFGVPGLKAAMDLKQGLYGGVCRAPLLSLNDVDEKVLVQTFAKCGYPLVR